MLDSASCMSTMSPAGLASPPPASYVSEGTQEHPVTELPAEPELCSEWTLQYVGTLAATELEQTFPFTLDVSPCLSVWLAGCHSIRMFAYFLLRCWLIGWFTECTRLVQHGAPCRL